MNTGILQKNILDFANSYCELFFTVACIEKEQTG